jgi:hypothetical protein
MPPVTKLSTIVTLQSGITSGPLIVPVYGWNCEYNAYGSLNHFHVKTSIQALKQSSINIYQLQDDDPHLKIQIHVLVDGNSTLIFAGEIDTVDGLWHQDSIEITGRDNSTILRDESHTLQGVDYINQPISKVVTQIAQKYGFGISKIDSTKQLAGVKYIPVGGAQNAFMDRPRPVWSVLQLLANEVGFLLYVTPQNDLVFAQPGSFTTNAPWQYYWRPQQKQQSSAKMPIAELHTTQQSKRCKNFVVQAWSNDRSTKIRTSAVSQDGDGSGIKYNRNIPGLDAKTVQQVADHIKAEIKRKKNTFKFTVDGNAQLAIGDLITVYESESNDLLGLSGVPCFISGLSQRFEMPSYEAQEGEGFFSDISANLYAQAEDES